MVLMPKLFVLDTSVLLFDHSATSNFQEHDIAIPITVLEELDQFKIGNDTKNFEARSVIRYLDKLSEGREIREWISLGPGLGRLKIVMNNEVEKISAIDVYGSDKNDHKIINAALHLGEKNPDTSVVLVTKDINLRIKAKALGLASEDYMTGKVQDLDNLSERSATKMTDLDASIIQKLYQQKKDRRRWNFKRK